MRMTRRGFLLGLGALTGAAAVPVALGGTESFLRRTLASHFGDDVLDIEGIGDFVSDYAANAGQGDWTKRMAAELYFAWRGDLVKKVGPAKALEDKFLETVLIRSNIIAMRQRRATEFEYSETDPWQPACSLYLSSLAEG